MSMFSNDRQQREQQEDLRQDVIIFDIDGTLADGEHRVHHVSGSDKNWFLYFSKMSHDTPRRDVCLLAELLGESPHVHSGSIKLVVCTGRPEQYREQTMTWLGKYVPALRKSMAALYMRGPTDHREDSIVKKEMLDNLVRGGHVVRLAIDDRQQVVNMWREYGVTCLQCAPGDF